jgi:hypothetical protein
MGEVSPFQKGPSGSIIVNVPAKGDCWLIALSAPIIGFVIDKTNKLGIIRRVRNRLSQIVTKDPDTFENIFEGGKDELERWGKKIKQWRPESSLSKWGGDEEFEIFVRITGICVHVLNSDFNEVSPPVSHFLPRAIKRFTETSHDGR